MNARFIEPMLLLRTHALPSDGDRWEYHLKFDGYLAIAATLPVELVGLGVGGNDRGVLSACA